MLLYSALQQMRLQSSIRSLAAFLRTVLEHLHERFLLAILAIVQQAHCGGLRLCHQLVASSLTRMLLSMPATTRRWLPHGNRLYT